MGRVADKVAIITGGARGMGAETARLFVREGAKVVIADMLAAEGEALAAEMGEAALFRKLDVTDEAQWQALAAEVEDRFGRIDALVNNAGVVAFVPIEEFTPELFDRVFSVNVKGTMLGMKHVGGVMKRRKTGAIVNISSIDGLRGANALMVYSASKWAVRGATKTAALELGPYGVRVNSVHPGGVDTVMGNPQGLGAAEKNFGYERVPLQRIGEPAEVATASLFLCSDEASYISAAELSVDGGWSAGYYHHYLPGAPPSLTGMK